MSVDLNKIIKAAKDTDIILTVPLQQWLMVHGDDPVPPDIAQRVYDELVKRPRDRTMSFSASSAGFCLRRQVLQYLGLISNEVIDPQLQNIFSDGKWRHLRWQTMLLMADLLDDIERGLRWKRMRSVGTMDGRGAVSDDHPKRSWRGKEYGFELKGVSGFQFPKIKKDEKMKEDHKNQVARYFLMSGLDLFIVVYEDKSTQDWFEWVFEPEDERVEDQREELEILNEAVDTETLPKMLKSCRMQVGPVFNECPYGGKTGACVRSGSWPNIRLRKRN